MDRLKDPHLPEYCNQLFNLHTVVTKSILHTVVTKSTLQSPHRMMFLMKGKKVMQQKFPLLNNNPTTNNQNKCFCLYEGKCISSRVTELEQTVQRFQRQIQDLQKDTVKNKNQWEYCSSQLNERGIPTDEPSLEDYQNWSCGNHYEC